jgi:hypothetical protein
MPQHAPDHKASGANLRLHEQFHELTRLTTPELRTLWRRQHQVQVPKGLSRDLLIRFIAWRLQEEALGGLGKPTLRRMEATRVQMKDIANGDAPRHSASLRPGTTLLREWNGTTHAVQVLADGFEYRGQRFASLTRVAAAISDLHRSGPAFFGLNRPVKRFPEQGRGLTRREAASE